MRRKKNLALISKRTLRRHIVEAKNRVISGVSSHHKYSVKGELNVQKLISIESVNISTRLPMDENSNQLGNPELHCEPQSEPHPQPLARSHSEFHLQPQSKLHLQSFTNTTKQSVSLKMKLANWVMTHYISHSATNSLLKMLIDEGHKLPNDCRTLLKTPRKICTQSLELGGEYYYFGLQSGIEYILKHINIDKIPETFELLVNVDGLPLTKSSNSQFWPILVYIKNIPKSDPFLVGAFHGNKKPTNLTTYLNPFIEEIMQGGVVIAGKCSAQSMWYYM